VSAGPGAHATRSAAGEPTPEPADPSLERYAALLEVAEEGLDLTVRGEIDALGAVQQRFEELAAALPARPPSAALPLLRRAALLHEAARAQLTRVRESLVSDASLTANAGRVARGYAQAGVAHVDRRA
jgi:hypothetical protein